MKPEYVSWSSLNSMAVAYKGKPAVYVANNLNYETELEIAVWDIVCKKFDDNQNLVSDLIHGGLFFFEDGNDALEFFNFFNSGALYASGIYAALYDESGNCLTENT